MNKILNILAKYWSVIFFVVLVISIGYTNPLPVGGWLTGWDNLHPEFWSEMNIGRSLSAVWQEYQGLGLLGGMGHAADLFRQILLWFSGFVIPANWLRYGYHFAMYLLGMVGTYFLLEKIVLKRYPEYVRKLASLIGALFYAFNLGTILYFYAPFEPYSTFWGMLPWEIYSLICYLENPNRKNLYWLLTINTLGVAQGYVQTLFLIYLFCVGNIVLGHIFAEKTWRSIKNGVVGGMLIILINAFWLLPAAYYVKTSVDEHNNATQIKFATEMFYLMNQGRGKLSDFVPMKLFYYDFTDWNVNGTGFDYFAPAWVKYYQNPLIVGITYAFVIIGIIGIFSKSRFKIQFGLIFLLGLIGFLSAERGINQLNELMRRNELFAQLFRNPYTKLIVPTVLTMSVFIGSGFAFVMNNKYFKHLMFIAGVGMVLLLARPVWQGEFFYRAERITIPSEYVSLFDYMRDKVEPTGRIALLPVHYIWGWANHAWGYRGSGFLWYGIKQPILDRAFDVWSEKNEGFYFEFSNAVYSGDDTRIESVIRKYDVKYLLLDTSVVDAGFEEDVFAYEKSKNVFEKIGYKKVFEEGTLIVWDTGIYDNQFVSAPKEYSLVEADTNKVREDIVRMEVGHYVSAVTHPRSTKPRDSNGQGSDTVSRVTYPFAGLMREETDNVEWGEGMVRIKNNELGVMEGQKLVIPGWEVGEIVRVNYATSSATTLGTQWEPLSAYYINGQPGPRFLGKEVPKEGESHIFAKVSEGEEWEEYKKEQKFEIRNEKLEIEVKGEPFVYDFAKQGQGSIGNCDVLKRGVATKTDNTYFADERGAVCDYIVMEAPFTRVPYLLRLRGENVEGRSIKFFLWNTGSKRNDIEYLLGKEKFDQTFALLPWDWDGYYTLNIETRSFGERAENRIDPVVGMYVPLDKIAKAKIVKAQNSDLPVINNANVKYVKKTGTWLYGLGVEGDGMIKLSQGYDEGWVGLNIGDWNWKKPLDSAQGLRHVKVDGWANGFVLDNDSGETSISNQIVIIFYWPQLLQYLGFVVLGITGLLLVLPIITKSK